MLADFRRGRGGLHDDRAFRMQLRQPGAVASDPGNALMSCIKLHIQKNI